MKKPEKEIDIKFLQYWRSLPESLRDRMRSSRFWKNNLKFRALILCAFIAAISLVSVIYYEKEINNGWAPYFVYILGISFFGFFIGFIIRQEILLCAHEMSMVRIVWGVCIHRIFITYNEIKDTEDIAQNYDEIVNSIEKSYQFIKPEIPYITPEDHKEFYSEIEGILYNWFTVNDHRLGDPMDELNDYFRFILIEKNWVIA